MYLFCNDKPQNFKENFILLWLITVTSVIINTSGGGTGKIALCRMYMYFEHAWSGYEAFGSAFERQIEYSTCKGVQYQTSWAAYYKGTYYKVINILTRGMFFG